MKTITIPIYKITFTALCYSKKSQLWVLLIRSSWLNVIKKDRHYQFPKQTNGFSTLCQFVPYNKRVTKSPNKFFSVPIAPMDISTRGMNVDFIFSEENTPQAFMEKITAIYTENRLDEDVIFATPNKETFLSTLKQLPIFIETNFKDKIQVVEEAKERYYNNYINPIIKHVSHDN